MSNYNLLIKQSSVLLLSLIAVFATAKHHKLEAQETPRNTTLEEISEGEGVVVGQEVTVRGETEEVEPGVSFVIEEEGFLEGDEVFSNQRFRTNYTPTSRRFAVASYR